MKKMKNVLKMLFYFAFLIIGFTLGIMTMLPDNASKPCLLGYNAHCSFTPISSIILFALGVIGLVLSIKLLKKLKTD